MNKLSDLETFKKVMLLKKKKNKLEYQERALLDKIKDDKLALKLVNFLNARLGIENAEIALLNKFNYFLTINNETSQIIHKETIDRSLKEELSLTQTVASMILYILQTFKLTYSETLGVIEFVKNDVHRNALTSYNRMPGKINFDVIKKEGDTGLYG